MEQPVTADSASQPVGSTLALEFWLELASNYSYLSVMRIERRAALAGVKVIWRPFLLGPIFKEFGWNTSPFVLQKQKGAYVWRDMERQARKHGIPWVRPSVFPRSSLLASRVALLGQEESWGPAFCKSVMLANFAEDRDITCESVISGLLDRLGLPAQELIQQASAEEVKQRLRAQTEQARQRGIFGAPTFFVLDEMFWGNDRLDDALEFARDRGLHAA